ncbi:MAG TPA: acyltransferase [Caulobacteraceae bacterium]|jgi:peptidoglycan/LPS O-acetylase OafA/YrhL
MTPSQTPRIKGFDGIRALAAFGVLLMHKTAIGQRFALGQYGVWLFFLLSGFLITSQLIQARGRAEARATSDIAELMAFWWRRSFRILPPYYALLTVFTVLYTVQHRPIPGLPWHVFYATNWFLEFKTPDGAAGTWSHFWSLAIEEQFYLLFAPLILLTSRKLAPWWCAGLLLAGIGRRIYMVEDGWPSFAIYNDSVVNLASLALGGLAGMAARKKALRGDWIGWLSLGLFLALPVILGLTGLSNDLTPLLALGVGVIAIAALHGNQDGALARVLSWKPIAYFGRISYGFYLYETYAPVALASKLLHRTGFAMDVLNFAVALGMSTLVAALSFELFEMPLQRFGRRFTIGRARQAKDVAQIAS